MGGIAVGKNNNTDGDYGSYLGFYARTNGSSLAEFGRFTTSGGFSIGSTTDPGAGNLLLNGLTASQYVKTDASKILCQLRAFQSETLLASAPESAQALGVNVGSAGAFTTFNGALGTPSSGTLTNCTFPTLNQNTTGSAASISISGQTGLFTVTGLTSTNRAKTVRDAADTILELGGSYTPTGTWTSLPLTNPKVTTAIQDANANSMLAFTATASAVDGFTFTNAATATLPAPQISVTGTDTNIDLKLTPKEQLVFSLDEMVRQQLRLFVEAIQLEPAFISAATMSALQLAALTF
jgi:hypothetical protein